MSFLEHIKSERTQLVERLRALDQAERMWSDYERRNGAVLEADVPPERPERRRRQRSIRGQGRPNVSQMVLELVRDAPRWLTAPEITARVRAQIPDVKANHVSIVLGRHVHAGRLAREGNMYWRPDEYHHVTDDTCQVTSNGQDMERAADTFNSDAHGECDV